MDADRWQQISRLYQAARARPDEHRGAFLEEACAGDDELRYELESLLACDAPTGEFLKTPAAATLSTLIQPDSDILPGLPEAGTKLGTYRIERLLGRGGMGAVFLAYDTTLHRRVALKVIETSANAEISRSRILREARNASALNHPNICTIYEVGHADGVTFIAMEYVEGRSLRDRLDQGPLSIDEAVRYGVQAADALAYSHDHGVVHRDFKAANVIVTEAAHLKVIDFGLARRADAMIAAASTMPSMVPAGTLAGTPYAMAPEQLRGDPTDARTDIWALGVLLYEIVTGAPPFAAATVPELFSAILRDPPARHAAISSEIRVVIERCLAKEPGQRFQTAAEIKAALELVASHVGRTPAVAVAAPSVAVLRFADMSPACDQAYLCEGIAEEIINALTRHPEFRVAARTSSFAVASRSAGADVREIGQQLNVATVVEGSVRKSGNRLRLTAQLIDAGTGYSIWSKNFDRSLEDVFAIQDEIAAAVAHSFERTLPSAPGLTRGGVTTDNVQAYELYLQGRYLWNRRPGDVVWQALKCFEKAVELDPKFAAAWAGIGDVYATLGSWESGVLPHAEAQDKARTYCQQALTIDPSLAEAHTTLAYVTLHYDWDPTAAEEGFQRALRLNPNYAAAHHWYSHCLAAVGRSRESLDESRRALELDPLNLLLNVHLAWHYFMARLPEQVIEQAERVIHMDPHFHWGHYFLGWGFEGIGQPAASVDAFRRAVRCSAANPVMQAALGRALTLNGDRTEALRIASELESAGGVHSLFAYEIALIHLGLSERSNALDWLERARRERSGWMAYSKVDPRLDSLRSELRFQQLVAHTA